MRPPCELVQRDFLPSLRANTAKRLHQSGFSQSEIARRLNITQAAVSKYLGQQLEKTSLSDEIEKLSSKLTTLILEGNSGPDILVKEICSACMISRIGSNLCHLHRESVPSLGEASCRICRSLLGKAEPLFTERAAALQDIDEAMAIISDIPKFSEIMPQVRANIVSCPPDAKFLPEVAGVPGRITLVGGRARSAEPPRFGASTHTASLLLWAKTVWPQIRACLCISGDDRVVKAAASLMPSRGAKLIRIKQSGGDAKSISQAVKAHVDGKYSSFQRLAIHVPGGVGIEPILYIFGLSAVNLARFAGEISEAV